VKNQNNRFDLGPFITHETTYCVDSKDFSSTRPDEDTNGLFTALINRQREVLGMVHTATASKKIENREPIPHSLLIEGAIVITHFESPEAVIDKANSRSEKRAFDDIIVVDAMGQFLGLISTPSLLRLQKAFYTSQVSLIQNSLDSALYELEDTRSDLTRANFRLNESHVVAKRLTEMRSEFVAKLGTEARTPMTQITGVLSLLLDLKVDPAKQEMLQSACSNAHTVLRLIDSVLDFTRIESNALTLSNAAFSPTPSIKQCVEALSAQAGQRGNTLVFQETEKSHEVTGDSIRLNQIFENLLCRASEQITNGTITTEVTERQTLNKLVTKIEITAKNGCGPNTNLQHLPESLSTPDPELDDLITLVSRKIANKMGGVIQHKKDEDGTLRCIIQIPFDLVSQEVAPSTINRLDPKNNAQPQDMLRILVIDDNHLNLEIIRRFLSRKGSIVHLADSGEEGLKLLKQHQIDGVFTDCQMPGMSGYEVAEHIRSGKSGQEYENIFIAAITASDHQSSWALCDEVGINYFIQKPVRSNSFDLALTNLREHMRNEKGDDSKIENAG